MTVTAGVKKILEHMSWSDKGKASIMHDRKAKDTLSAWNAFFCDSAESLLHQTLNFRDITSHIRVCE